MTGTRARLLGLAATLALLAALAGVPTSLLAIGAIPDAAAFTWTNLMRPDDGTLALNVARGAVWVLWVLFTASVGLEVAATVRTERAPQLPGLALPQVAVARLVGTAALLFVAIPSVTAVAVIPKAHAAGVAPPPPDRQVRSAPLVPKTQTPAPISAPNAALTNAAPAPRTDAYTVQRGDSLWKIAQRHLGDGSRYAEIRALNQHVLGENPDFITPGTVLRVPHVERDDESYVVESGDTLTQIAEDELHDSGAWPQIAAASRHIAQPGGEHLADPDLIKPGWHLEIPETRPATRPGTPAAGRPQAASRPQPPVPEAPAPADTAPAPDVSPPGNQPTTADHAQPDHAQSDHVEPDHDQPGWLLPGLAGSGAALAGALLLVLRQHRRTQLRLRGAGRIVAPTPPELLAVEKTAYNAGTLIASKIDLLDLALRHLASTGAPKPITATLGTDEIAIHLEAAAELPAPLSGSGTSWAIYPQDVPRGDTEVAAPYPLLVSIGSNADGELVYVNLEQLRTVTLTGDREHSLALARHIAAELALSPWSSLVEIETHGLGAELADIDRSRLRPHVDDDTGFIQNLATTIDAEDTAQDPDRFRATILLTDTRTSDATERLATTIADFPGRSGAAVVTVGESPDANVSIDLRIDNRRRLTCTALGLDLTAAGLTSDEARACAHLASLTRQTKSIPMPTPAEPDAVADLAGALLPAHTSPRPVLGDAGATSLLPAAAATYEAMAAITAEDVRTLAPTLPQAGPAATVDSDPALDDDLAYWRSRDVDRPKLRLLGPVRARTSGVLGERPYRIPFRTEVLALLTLHPRGLTIDDLCEALHLGDGRVRKDISLVRRWLGGPDDQHTYLPGAREPGHESGRYVVQDVVCDLDLFRRLRTRGQMRGADGIEDLRRALALVRGEPFTDLRPHGWDWLLEGDRHDQIAVAAIADVAHILTTRGLCEGDLDLAKFAAEKGYLAAPYDESACLDMIAVEKALGHDEEAERRLRQHLSRTDDDLGPVDPPDATTQIIRQRSWVQTSRTG